MFESILPTLFRRVGPGRPEWRVSTWWPGDTLESMQRSLIRLLAVAHQERLEVAPLVANLANEHRGRYRRRLRRLAKWLADGTPLIDAIEQTPDVLRDEDALALRFANQSGTLGSTYQRLVSESTSSGDQHSAMARQCWIYAFVTLAVLGWIVCFLVFFIVPTLRHMHDEFGIATMHPMTSLFISTVDWITRHLTLLVVGILVVAFLAWSAPSRRFFRRMLAGRWIRSVAKTRSSQLLNMLAMTVESGRPLPGAISTLARYHFDPSVRQKLLYARNEIEQGNDAWQSLVEAGLLKREESVAISQAPTNASRAWTMRQLADWKLHQIYSRSVSRAYWLQPAITLLFAGLVLLVGSAMIGFLAQMIHTLAQPV